MGRIGKRNAIIRKNIDRLNINKKIEVQTVDIRRDVPEKNGQDIKLVEPNPNEPKIQNYGFNTNNVYYNYVYNSPNITNFDIKLINERLDTEINKKQIEFSFIDLFSFKAFIKDKTIALIANSTDLLKNKLGKQIDSHDIVVRFNSYKIDEEFTGKKTTIHTSVYLQDENLNEYAPIRFIISYDLKNWLPKITTLNKYKQGAILKYNHQQILPNKVNDPTPTTSGTTVLLLLLKLGGYSKINLFGYNFYKTGEDSIFRNEKGMLSPISNIHNYELEKNFVMLSSHKYNERNNIITFDGNSPL